MPVSPSTSTSISASANWRTTWRSRCIGGLSPVSGSSAGASASARKRRLSITSARWSSDRRTAATRWSVANGLVRKSAAPARIAATAIATSPCPVIRMTGISRSMPVTAASNSSPSMCGIRMSLTTMPGNPVSIAASAWSARANGRTSSPARSSACAVASRSVSSSSTKRTALMPSSTARRRWRPTRSGDGRCRRPGRGRYRARSPARGPVRRASRSRTA